MLLKGLWFFRNYSFKYICYLCSSFKQLFIYYYSLQHRWCKAYCCWCRGSFTINGSVGEIPSIDFTFIGIYNAPTDTALPTTTYGNQATPLIFKNGNTTGFQLLSHSAALQSISLDVGNELVYRELVGGTKETLITNRNISGTVQIEAMALGTKDYFAAAIAETTGNLTFLHGTTAGNKVQVTSTKADIGDVAYSDMDGIQMLDIPYTLVPSAANDEISIVYT